MTDLLSAFTCAPLCAICNDTGKLDDAQAWDCGQPPSDCPYCPARVDALRSAAASLLGLLEDTVRYPDTDGIDLACSSAGVAQALADRLTDLRAALIGDQPVMKERHRAAMNDSTSPLTPRGLIWQAFLDTGKVDINELLWRHLPPEATLQMAEEVALNIWNEIALAWERFPFPTEVIR